MQVGRMRFGSRELDFQRAHVMGILNVTPDSFSDGGCFARLDDALRQAEKMVLEGAAIIDVGGESTRPGAAMVSVQEEMDRVLPVVERLVRDLDVIVSVDTSSAELMTESARMGVGLLNDVRAFTREGAEAAAINSGVPLCLMHMQGQPDTMQGSPAYSDVVSDVSGFLKSRVEYLVSRGVDSGCVLIDPGFGFGKTVHHNYQMLKSLEQFCQLGYPVLVGLSRKSMIGAVTGREPNERLAGSLAAATASALKGAAIVRVHDVKETVDAIKVVNALREIQ